MTSNSFGTGRSFLEEQANCSEMDLNELDKDKRKNFQELVACSIKPKNHLGVEKWKEFKEKYNTPELFSYETNKAVTEKSRQLRKCSNKGQ